MVRRRYVEGWIHSNKRNRLGQKNVERLLRVHTNLKLEAVLTDWREVVLPWDVEMIFDEPDDEDGVVEVAEVLPSRLVSS